MYFNLNLYGTLDESEKNDLRYIDIRDTLYNNRISFIKYQNLPKTIKGSMIEFLLTSCGIAVIGKNKKKEWKVGYPLELKTMLLSSLPFDSNGIPFIKKGMTINGEELTDCYVLRNNYLCKPNDLFIKRLSNQLTRVSMSESKLVDKSICNPVPLARTENAYQGIKKVMQDIDSTISVIKIEGEKNEWSEQKYNDYDVLDFTNISYADKFKYLTTYYNDLWGRFFETFGFALHNPTKQAQTNTDELANKEESDDCYIKGMLDVRLEDWQIINDELGWSVIPYLLKDEIKKEMEKEIEKEEITESGVEIYDNSTGNVE